MSHSFQSQPAQAINFSNQHEPKKEHSCQIIMKHSWKGTKGFLVYSMKGTSYFAIRTISAPASTAAGNAAGSTEETQTCRNQWSIRHVHGNQG